MRVEDIPDTEAWCRARALELMGPRTKDVSFADCTRVVTEDYQVEDDTDSALASRINDLIQQATVQITLPQ